MTAELRLSNTEEQEAKGGIAFLAAAVSCSGICVARGMKYLNEAVRMGLGSVAVTSPPPDLGEYRGIEHAAVLPEAGASNLYSLGAACC